ncbi:hypothetical protein WJX81_004817 [Elliptochloris bilobata]|uniref:Uncharacterized protein n=1 Tax=Elliptochloris bilobata TaxID=381761 RepID=A0AAW1S688_9CHLO
MIQYPTAVAQNSVDEARRSLDDADEHAPAAIPQLAGVSALPARYKGVLLDQYGVLHDGQKAYPGAVAAVEALAAAGRKLLVLSNSSRRSGGVLRKLAKLGFPEGVFVGVLTSGEIAHTRLAGRKSGGWFWEGLGSRCLHMTWAERGAILLEGLDLEVVTVPDQADFILAHGTQALGSPGGAEVQQMSMEALRALLPACAARGIPMLVANPDVVTVDAGLLVPMPGMLAQWYEELGGEVVLLGKPAAVLYEEALRMLGLRKDEVLAIGDSLQHDIAGAHNIGLDSLFVAGGIHAADLGVPLDSDWEPDREDLDALLYKHNTRPTMLMAYLKP